MSVDVPDKDQKCGCCPSVHIAPQKVASELSSKYCGRCGHKGCWSVIPAPGSLRQEHGEFKASLGTYQDCVVERLPSVRP